ncbi:MAG: heme-binding protein [Gammaproteobacteria bacterium]|jgi:hypothetical protein|nr:heme-binding protein [Gammaproteobacteria bacterium]NBX40093.1 heme-binding protein [Gammaproteobacteria bacterium]
MTRALASAIIGITLSFFGGVAMAIEQPEYRVLESDGAFELREYQPYMLAETAVDASFLTAGNIAFGRLFRYISEKKIAMTAPVEQASSGGTYRVAFVVPRQFDRRSVPVPSDPRVTIREVPSRVVGAWRYSGRWTEENFRAAERSLREQLARRHLDPLPGDAAIIARYDAPFIPWFMRRNEVLLPLRSSAAGH